MTTALSPGELGSDILAEQRRLAEEWEARQRRVRLLRRADRLLDRLERRNMDEQPGLPRSLLREINELAAVVGAPPTYATHNQQGLNFVYDQIQARLMGTHDEEALAEEPEPEEEPLLGSPVELQVADRMLRCLLRSGNVGMTREDLLNRVGGGSRPPTPRSVTGKVLLALVTDGMVRAETRNQSPLDNRQGSKLYFAVDSGEGGS